MKGPIWVLLSELKRKAGNKILLCCLLLFLNSFIFSQNSPAEFCMLFYNAENLFDPFDNPDTQDEEFTPKGTRHWTYKRMNRKLLALSKVMLNAAGYSPPQMIGLCEIENRFVLEKLLETTPLKAYAYRIIHKESPDNRGIDVAFLYESTAFNPISYQYISLRDQGGNELKTREILYVSGILNRTDTLHIFVNHWPSRYGGLLESLPGRELAARTLRVEVEKLQKKYRNPRIIITGDFNDQPDDKSLSQVLEALPLQGVPSEEKLYNLSYPWMKREIKTIKYQSQWSVFDQFIVSGSLLNEANKIYTRANWASIADMHFLLEEDIIYGGRRIKRTYNGFRYNGGFSDHLPVLLKLAANP